MGGLLRLAQFVSGLKYEQLPQEVIEKVKVILLHNFSVAFAGADGLEQIRQYRSKAGLPSPGESTVLMDGSNTTAETAAFLNGLLFHSRAQDDVHNEAGTHIGCIVLPAALAVAESRGATPQEMIEAIVAGYEAVSLIGSLHSKISTQRGFRSSAIYGPFASAAAAAKLYKLDVNRTVNALALAANFSAGLNQTWIAGTGEWRVQTSMAAMHGIMAAKLALSGFDAAPDILEGEKGFFYAFTGEQRDIEERCDKLGKEWGIFEVSFKPYPVCAINQVPVHMLRQMMQEHPFSMKDVQKIRIGLCPYDAQYPGIDWKGPYSGYGAALMSAQFCLAVLVKEGKVTVEALGQVHDPEILRLVQRIEIFQDESLSRYGCMIEVALNDGYNIHRENRLGSKNFQYPFETALEQIENLREEMMIEEAQFGRWCDWIKQAENQQDLSEMITLIQP